MDNTNIGLLNLSENGLNKFGIGEILTVLLVMLVLGIIIAYHCKKRRQARLREMEQSMRNSLGVYRPAPASSELYPHRQAILMVTFSNLKNRVHHYQDSGKLASRRGVSRNWGFNDFNGAVKSE